jgi:microcystin degradation protein MlrC
MRIAVGGIHTECSTYSPVLMGEQDFRVFRGAELLEAEYFNFLGEGGAEVLPLLHARAVPLYLAMHGAMNVEGMDDAEGDWISSARAVVGPDVVVSASYDLHGNVSQTIIDQLDIFAGYRTAPHIDVRETMVRAWTMLLKALKTGEKPGVAWAKIPVLLPGEKTSTEDEPTKSLYAVLPDHDARPGIWDANFMIGYVWADEPRATACAVVTGTDKAAAQAVAIEIAQSYWNARQDFRFGPMTKPLEAILDIAENTATRPIILADSGDNPTGGGVGDRADVLVALIARNWQDALLGGITDRPAVEACFAAGEGATLSLKIGGSLDPQSPSVTVEARVVKLDDPGAADQRQAVVAIGGITVILAARRRPYHMISDFTRLGFNPKEVRLLVVKSGYLSPELAPIANPNLMALTEGVINQDIENLPNRRRDGDFYPWKPHFDYTPQPILSARWR